MSRRSVVAALAILVLVVAGVSCRRRPIVVVRPPLPTMTVPTAIPTVPQTTAVPLPSSAASPKASGGGEGGRQGGGSKSSGSGDGSGSGSGSSTTTPTSSGLPKGFPSNFPIPPANRAVASAQTSGVVLSVWFAGPQRQDQLASFFATALPGAGWTITPLGSATGVIRSGAVYAVSGHGWNGTLAIGEGYRAAAGYEGVFSFFVRLAR